MKQWKLARDGAEVWRHRDGELCYITAPSWKYRNGRKVKQIGHFIRWIVDKGDGTADGAAIESITLPRFRAEFSRDGRVLTPLGQRFTIKNKG